jgi:NADPH:quinone reductase-like Zn-dependent oxidoreductase
MGSLKPGGRYLMGNPRMSDMLRAGPSSWLSDKQVTVAFAGETVEELRDLAGMLERGELRVPIDGVYAPERAAEAHRRVETEERIGAVVIDMTTQADAGVA